MQPGLPAALALVPRQIHESQASHATVRPKHWGSDKPVGAHPEPCLGPTAAHNALCQLAVLGPQRLHLSLAKYIVKPKHLGPIQKSKVANKQFCGLTHVCTSWYVVYPS